MVAATPSLPELPQLTERESELLAHFLILRYDMVALAEANKLLPQQLLAFAHSPAVNAHLASLRSFAETALALRHLEARTKALDILEKVATTSDNPVEQRRAASTIFRGTGLQRARVSQSPPAPGGGAGGSPGKGRGRVRSGGGSVLTSSPVQPLPFAAPSPALSPEDLLHELASALADRADPAAAATIEGFLAENATINGAPVAPGSAQATLDEHIPESEVVQTQVGSPVHHPGPPESCSAPIDLIHDGGRQIRIKANLSRIPSGPHAPPRAGWLISSLDIGPNTS